MKVLVLVRAYPDDNGNRYMMYVHVRNMAYLKSGIDVTVVNFTADHDYFVDGIRVLKESSFAEIQKNEKFDCLISHATNIRNHYRFINKFNNCFNRIIYFFHGHEILIHSEDYPKDYSFVKGSNFIYTLIQNAYDRIKLVLLRKIFVKYINKSEFVFVSPWIERKFYQNIKLQPEYVKNRTYVINNSVGELFEFGFYNKSCEKKYDYISIREDIDGSKYCVDIINECAKNNPDKKFCLVGTGKFFSYFDKSPNIERIERKLSHNEIISLLDASKVALMPTREDTQGVMTCEMATFGMPVITSNIEVCRLVFNKYPNVILLDNNKLPLILNEETNKLLSYNYKIEECKLYTKAETINKEIDLLLFKSDECEEK